MSSERGPQVHSTPVLAGNVSLSPQPFLTACPLVPRQTIMSLVPSLSHPSPLHGASLIQSEALLALYDTL